MECMYVLYNKHWCVCRESGGVSVGACVGACVGVHVRMRSIRKYIGENWLEMGRVRVWKWVMCEMEVPNRPAMIA